MRRLPPHLQEGSAPAQPVRLAAQAGPGRARHRPRLTHSPAPLQGSPELPPSLPLSLPPCRHRRRPRISPQPRDGGGHLPGGQRPSPGGGRGGTGTGRLLLEAVAPPSRPVPSRPVSFHFIPPHPTPSHPVPAPTCRPRGAARGPRLRHLLALAAARFSASPALPGPAPLRSAPLLGGRTGALPAPRHLTPGGEERGRGYRQPPAAPGPPGAAAPLRPAPPAAALRGSRGAFVWGWRRQGSEETPALFPLNVCMLSTKRNNATYGTRFGPPHPVSAGSGWCGGAVSMWRCAGPRARGSARSHSTAPKPR